VNIFNDHDLEVFDCPHVPGLLRFRSKEDPRKSPTDLGPEMKELISKLKLKRPTWLLAQHDVASEDTVYVFSEDKEYLGTIGYIPSQYYGVNRSYFELTNFRILQKSLTASAARSYSVKKAVERILANYRPRSFEEHMETHARAAYSAIERAVGDARTRWVMSKNNSYRLNILAAVLDNPKAFTDTPAAPFLNQDLLTEWGDYTAAISLTNKSNFEIITEVERDGAKQLYNITGTPNAYWLDPEQHHETISKVAMLRMVDIGQVVKGVGFRSDDNTFVVLCDTV
jgi:hypothetical protein